MISIKWFIAVYALASLPSLSWDVLIGDIGTVSAWGLLMGGALCVPLVVLIGPIVLAAWVFREIYRDRN